MAGKYFFSLLLLPWNTSFQLMLGQLLISCCIAGKAEGTKPSFSKDFLSAFMILTSDMHETYHLAIS